MTKYYFIWSGTFTTCPAGDVASHDGLEAETGEGTGHVGWAVVDAVEGSAGDSLGSLAERGVAPGDDLVVVHGAVGGDGEVLPLLLERWFGLRVR